MRIRAASFELRAGGIDDGLVLGMHVAGDRLAEQDRRR